MATRPPCPARILEDAGSGFLLGWIGGGIFGGFRGIIRGLPGAKITTSKLDFMSKALRVSRGFAAWTLLYATFDCVFSSINGGPQVRNSVSAAFCTGYLLGMKGGVASAIRSGIGGGILLGVIEGILNGLDYIFSESYPTPLMVEQVTPHPPNEPPPAESFQRHREFDIFSYDVSAYFNRNDYLLTKDTEFDNTPNEMEGTIPHFVLPRIERHFIAMEDDLPEYYDDEFVEKGHIPLNMSQWRADKVKLPYKFKVTRRSIEPEDEAEDEAEAEVEAEVEAEAEAEAEAAAEAEAEVEAELIQ